MKEYNEMLAGFMGYTKYLEDGVTWWQAAEEQLRCLHVTSNQFKYHTSWDWLIPVCYKWDCLQLEDFNEKQLKEYIRLCDKLDEASTCYKIEPVYNQIVINIKWYINETRNTRT